MMGTNMESQPRDDWLDKLMLFFANWSRAIAEEWFKFAQWFLVMAAFSFLWKVTSSLVYLTILGISFVALWCYLMFGYQALWNDLFHGKFRVNDESLKGNMLNGLIWALGAIIALVVAVAIARLTLFVAEEAATILYTKQG